MSYAGFYDNLPPDLMPTGSRANVYTSSGQICFNSCSISFVHGTTPGVANVNYNGTSNVVPGDEVVIEIGNSTFYGYATALKQNTDFKKGRSYDLTCVDTRDRLLDLNHYAQYNMIDDDDGIGYHMLAWEWKEQIPAYIFTDDGISVKALDIDDFDNPPELENQINIIDYQDLYLADPKGNSEYRKLPLLTAYQILDYLGVLYGFNLSATESAMSRLVSTIPENLNFNNGAKISEVIELILSSMNLQYYVHGDLIVEITEKGKPQGPFEQSLMAGTVDFCAIPGFTKANIGAELNEKGRRIVINGDLNLHEFWFICRPDWHPFFDWNMIVNAGAKQSAFLAKHNVTRKSLIRDLPEEYQDWTEHPTDEAKDRRDMTIGDYIDQICYKYFAIDFEVPGSIREQGGGNEDALITARHGIAEERDNVKNRWHAGGALFNIFFCDAVESLFKLNEHLVSDSERKSIVRKTSRKIDGKGIRPKHLFLNGRRVYTDQGYSIKETSSVGDSFTYFNNQASLIDPAGAEFIWMENVKRYMRRVVFNEPQLEADWDEELGEFVFTPALILIKLALQAGKYQYIHGETGSDLRVRETIVEVPAIKKKYIETTEQQLLTNRFKTVRTSLNGARKELGIDAEKAFTDTMTSDQLAVRAAQARLNHEYITTAGTIEMIASAGFMPSGIIQSVRVDYNNSLSGGTLKEVIRFTNELTDPDLKELIGGKRKLNNMFEKDLIEKAQRDKDKDARARLAAGGADPAGQGGGGGIDGSLEDNGGMAPDQLQNAFDKNGSVMVEIEASDVVSDGDIEEGELLILEEAVGTDVEPY